MSEGNGFDIAAVYLLLREVADRVIAHDGQFKEAHVEIAGIRQELQRDLAALRRDMRSDVASLRQTVTENHASVLGHGILISELEGHVRRIEEHLHLPPAA